jgi:hypothetical protein
MTILSDMFDNSITCRVRVVIDEHDRHVEVSESFAAGTVPELQEVYDSALRAAGYVID